MPDVVEPIGFVHSPRVEAEDDHWGRMSARITLTDRFGADALQGLTAFSHVEVVFLFHQVDAANVTMGARHPRNNHSWPAVGIFAQRGRSRPNRIGTTVCRVAGVEGTTLDVSELDAIDGTPVLDLKPVMREFLPRDPVRQPAWSHEIMTRYWLAGNDERTAGQPAQADASSEYEISDDKWRLDIDVIHGYLTRSYWSPGIPRATVEKGLEHALCFGVYRQSEQVGFARVITDTATFAYLADVFILEAHRGKGLSKRLMTSIVAHPDLQGLRRFLLATRDAHGLYRQHGFTELVQPSNMMEILRRNAYTSR